MARPTEIYRFGHYVTEVPDNKESLRKWIMENCPYDNVEKTIPPSTTLLDCLKIAKEKGYNFNTPIYEAVTDRGVKRLVRILEFAKFPDVAKDLTKYKVKGENLICSCPACDTDGSILVMPKFQTYRCFSCGKTGNVVSFVMDILKMDYETAIDFLETKYIK